jgi:hypothetical protein
MKQNLEHDKGKDYWDSTEVKNGVNIGYKSNFCYICNDDWRQVVEPLGEYVRVWDDKIIIQYDNTEKEIMTIEEYEDLKELTDCREVSRAELVRY